MEMMRKWRRHTIEFKRQVVERMKTCENIEALARELDLERKLLYTNYGEALAASGQRSEALLHLRHAVEVAETDPSHSPVERWKLIEPLRMLGAVEAELEEFASSRAHIDRCLQLSLALWPEAREDLRSFAMIGKAYEAIGDLERLMRHADAACAAYRKSLATWQAWPTLGKSSFYDRNHAAAVSAKLAACWAPVRTVPAAKTRSVAARR